MSYLTDLCEGFAQLIAADADPAQNIQWVAAGLYPNGKTGIYVAHVPLTPNRVITLTAYGYGDDATFGDTAAGLQVRTRSIGPDPRDVYALDDAVADVLLGRYPVTLPSGIRVQTLTRSSSTSLGLDDNQRWSHVSNYDLGLHRPGPHRL